MRGRDIEDVWTCLARLRKRGSGAISSGAQRHRKNSEDFPRVGKKKIQTTPEYKSVINADECVIF